MSHEITAIDGFAFTGSRADIWHGLGANVPDDTNLADFMKAASIDWTVEKKQAYLHGAKGRLVKIENSFGLICSDNDHIINSVSKNWQPRQNVDVFNVAENLIEAGAAKWSTMGSLREREVVFATAKLETSFEVFHGDVVDSYLLITNPHKYGTSSSWGFTTTRVVCANTMRIAHNEMNVDKTKSSKITQNHCNDMDSERIKNFLKINSMAMDEYRKQVLFLGEKRFTDTDVEYFARTLFPVVKAKENLGKRKEKEDSKGYSMLLECLHTQPGAQYAEGSFWQLLNAATYTTNHLLGRSEATRLDSVLYGEYGRKNDEALKLALAMAS